MPRVRELSSRDLRERLEEGKLLLTTGDYVSRIHSGIHAIAVGVEAMYADYEVVDESGFADFHVELRGPRSLRRWIRGQVLFYCDGKSPFKPLPLAQAFPLLEWGLNWCVASHSHERIVIH